MTLCQIRKNDFKCLQTVLFYELPFITNETVVYFYEWTFPFGKYVDIMLLYVFPQGCETVKSEGEISRGTNLIPQQGDKIWYFSQDLE